MIEVGDSRYRMEHTEQGSFRHVFPMVRESVRFLLTASGVRGLTYVQDAPFLGEDGEATVDGSHPTDLGMVRYADALEPILRSLI